MTASKPHPMQEVIMDDGTPRFRVNAIVRFLLDNGVHDMNTLSRMQFSKEDRSQFAQLIGYSTSGFGDLSYAVSKHVGQADAMADLLMKKAKREKKAK